MGSVESFYLGKCVVFLGQSLPAFAKGVGSTSGWKSANFLIKKFSVWIHFLMSMMHFVLAIYIQRQGAKITQTWIFTSLSSTMCPSVTKGSSPKPPFQTGSSGTFYWPFSLKIYWNKERCRCFIKDAICIFPTFRVSFLVCNLCD